MAMPVIQISIDGQDVSSRVNARVLSGSCARHDGEKADEMRLILSNFDGQLAKPQRGQTLTLAVGFVDFGGPVDRGSYIVQHIVKSGPPAIFEVTAQSADLKKTLKQQKTRTWTTPKKLGDVLQQIASDNGLSAAIDGTLAALPIDKIIAQTGESDMHLITRLARRYGAIGKVAQGRLPFVPLGSGTTASGAGMPAITLTPEDCESFRIGDDDRKNRGKSHASVWDRSKATKTTYSASAGDDGPDYSHPETFAQPTEAQAAAGGRAKDFARAKTKFEATLRPPAPPPAPGGVLTTQGFGDDDDHDWIVKTVTDEWGDGGLVTKVNGERKV
jgi:phage protein D